MAPQGRKADPRAPLDRPFVNPNAQPTEEGLENALGEAVGRFDIVRGLAPDFEQEWSFYRGSGWMMRIHDGRKSLLYLVPLRKAFKMSMAIREAERDAFVSDVALAALRPALDSARRAPEGFALAFDIDAETDFPPLRALVERLIAARQG